MAYIGVLALQGGFQKHLEKLQELGVEARAFRELSELSQLSGLIIPGGESTTIGMLLDRRTLLEPLKHAILDGLPVFGTCAGAILLAKNIEGSSQLRLGTMDLSVKRNAYGTQIDSFEATIEFENPEENKKEEIPAVFIRAPIIFETSGQVLSRFNDSIVVARQKNMLAATFHPELTPSRDLHRYFIKYLCGQKLA